MLKEVRYDPDDYRELGHGGERYCHFDDPAHTYERFEMMIGAARASDFTGSRGLLFSQAW